MFPASIPSDPGTLLLALFTLFGLPLIIFSLVLFYAGYIRYDADQSLEELQAQLEEAEAGDGADEGAEAEPGDEIEGAEAVEVTEADRTVETSADVPPNDAEIAAADDVSRSNTDQ